MINPRIYGNSPFSVAVIHGGPGAGGEMGAVAQKLCIGRGILEPLQTAHSLQAQVEELKGILEECADLPVTLIGFSWGAWLSFILAARYPAMVKKLVLIGSGPFQEKYVPIIMQTRLSRLDRREESRVRRIFVILDEPSNDDREKNRALALLGELFSRTDAFDPIKCQAMELNNLIIPCQADINESVWKEASLLRQTGELLELGKRILCPVVAMHGDWDPHPCKGVSEPLQATLKSFKFILLEDCGHKPWIEKRARDKFYSILEEVISCR
ncbi:MAG: Alpha/beta hydrolase family protein [Euryarchaeota archaeon]|nr:Alpha/beta hydrolase family protein [Euryarchaeota archaeon]